MVYANPAALRLAGAASTDHVLGQLITDVVHAEAILLALTRMAVPHRPGDRGAPVESLIYRFDDTVLDVEATTTATTWGGRLAYQTVLREIEQGSPQPDTAHLTEPADHLTRSGVMPSGAEYFETVVTSLDRGVVVIGRNGGIVSINPAAIRILGSGAGRFPGTHSERALDFPLFDTDGHVLPAAQRPVNVTLRTGRPVHGQVLGMRRHDGCQMWISFSTALLDPDDPERSSVLLSLADVTAEHLVNKQLRHHAHHDALTGLPNRSRTLALITAALTPNDDPQLAALMFIDIDQFKQINDSFGHLVGDQVLRTCAERLQGVLRSTDTLTRVGGDEFVALIAAPADIDDLQQLAQRLHDALKHVIAVDAQFVTTSVSIGVAGVDVHRSDTPVELLRRADIAMYQAKMSGPGQTRFHLQGGITLP